ncbi:hypothetical protein ACXZ65_17330 [Streptomyces aculeolatus]
MDAKATYTTSLTELRALRDEIERARAALVKLEAERDKQITALAPQQQAKAERIAPAAGLKPATTGSPAQRKARTTPKAPPTSRRHPAPRLQPRSLTVTSCRSAHHVQHRRPVPTTSISLRRW